MKINKNKKKAFSSLVTCILAAVLSLISFSAIKYGVVSKNTFHEKQALDSCGYSVGYSLIYYNNIDKYCSNLNQNSCNFSSLNVISEDTIFKCQEQQLVCEDDKCYREFIVSSKYNPGLGTVEKSVSVKINEEVHDVERIDAAVIFLLDYSGSMNGNRITQLKNAVSQFINYDYNLSYAVLLYNENVITTSNISKGLNHDQTALSIVDTNQSGGGTNFVKPIEKALELIQNSEHETYYIVLVSDGSPNEGINESLNLVNQRIMSIDNSNCIYSTKENPCITMFTLGVDNADMSALEVISGNTILSNSEEYSYKISANQTSIAFNAIIEEIMCRIGPLESSGDIYVFDELQILEENIDYIYDNQHKILKFYDSEPHNSCTRMIENNSNITIRWGKPLVEVIR